MTDVDAIIAGLSEGANEHVSSEDIWAAAPIAKLFARHRQSAEQRMIDIAQACLDQGYPLAVALEMMKGQNDG